MNDNENLFAECYVNIPDAEWDKRCLFMQAKLETYRSITLKFNKVNKVSYAKWFAELLEIIKYLVINESISDSFLLGQYISYAMRKNNPTVLFIHGNKDLLLGVAHEQERRSSILKWMALKSTIDLNDYQLNLFTKQIKNLDAVVVNKYISVKALYNVLLLILRCAKNDSVSYILLPNIEHWSKDRPMGFMSLLIYVSMLYTAKLFVAPWNNAVYLILMNRKRFNIDNNLMEFLFNWPKSDTSILSLEYTDKHAAEYLSLISKVNDVKLLINNSEELNKLWMEHFFDKK